MWLWWRWVIAKKPSGSQAVWRNPVPLLFPFLDQRSADVNDNSARGALERSVSPHRTIPERGLAQEPSNAIDLIAMHRRSDAGQHSML